MGLFGDIGGFVGSFFGGHGGSKAMNEAVDAWRKLKATDFDFSKLTAPELEMVGEMMPVLRTAIMPEAAPEIADSPEARNAIARQLAGLEDIAEEGLPLVDRLQQQQMSQQVMGQQQRATQNILRDLAARGAAGGGTELQARLAGQQGAMQTASDLGAQMEGQAALRRLQAGSQAGQLAGQLRGQDISLNQARSAQAERFNQIVAAILNQVESENVAAQRQAEAYNLNTQQALANQNALMKLAQEQANIDRYNELKQTQTAQEFQRGAGLSNVLLKKSTHDDAERARRAAQASQVGRVGGEVGGAAIGAMLGGAGIGGFGGGGWTGAVQGAGTMGGFGSLGDISKFMSAQTSPPAGQWTPQNFDPGN